jgi:two-component SAPR family response regulator
MRRVGARKGCRVDHGADLAGLRILIVEDEFLLAMELEALLQQRGCMILGPVSSVGHALGMLDGEQPDVALLDVNLKGERATPVAAALQARGVPFVLITGYSGPQLSEPELRNAPRIDKPVNCRLLKRAVETALSGNAPS